MLQCWLSQILSLNYLLRFCIDLKDCKTLKLLEKHVGSKKNLVIFKFENFEVF